MTDVIKVDKNETKLSGLGLDYDNVLGGARAELDPVKKTNRKTKYVSLESYDLVVEAYADDLLASYESNESMEERIAELEAMVESRTAELTKASNALQKSQTQLKEILDSDEGLRLTEELLSTLEDQIDRFEKSKILDDSTIASLRAQVADLEADQLTVQQIADETDAVFANLRAYFEEEGITLEDDML